MNVTIVDYKSGNISSVINSFKEVAKDKVKIEVTSELSKIKLSDKVVLPGQGSFKSCVDALKSINGLVDSLNDFAMINKKPLLGICVGLQMFADVGYEETETKGWGASLFGSKAKTEEVEEDIEFEIFEDDAGNEMKMTIHGALEVEGDEYAIMSYQDNSGFEIMKINRKRGGKVSYSSVDDSELYDDLSEAATEYLESTGAI